MYDKNALLRWRVTDYRTQARPNIRAGDLFFTSGIYPLSQIIKQLSHSIFSHVGIVFYVEQIDRLLVLESVETAGVRFSPLSKYLFDYSHGKPYEGRVYIARYDQEIPERILLKMADTGCKHLARPYDMEELVTIMARICLGSRIRKREGAYVCSELVYECFKAANIHFKYNKHQFISPDDIAKDKKVKFLYRLL